MRRCTRCKEYKDRSSFGKDSCNKDGIRLWCRQCVADQRHDYYLRNKEQIVKWSVDRIRELRKNDPFFRFKMNVRSLITSSFSKKGIIKSLKTEEILGISLKEFYNYLLTTFKEKYKREYVEGEDRVDIDHIIPLFIAKTEEEVIKLNHYTNLRLIFRFDNRKKGYRIEK